MYRKTENINDISQQKGHGFHTNHVRKYPGKFLVWVSQGTYLNLGSTNVV
jgi:hypothetical protein